MIQLPDTTSSCPERDVATEFTLWEIASSMRDVLELVLASSLGNTDTQGTCLYAAILLNNAISQFTDAVSSVCGGGPPADGGILDLHGDLQGHYWVEVTLSTGQSFVVDITSDQFGFEKVIVCPLDVARRRYSPGNTVLIGQHVQAEMAFLERSSFG